MANEPKEMHIVDYGRLPVKVLNSEFPPKTTCFPVHWHDRIEILRIYKGELSVSVGGNKIVAKSGDVVVINPKQPHTAVSGENGVNYGVVMSELSRLATNAYYGEEYIKPLIFRRKMISSLVTDLGIAEVFDRIVSEKQNENPLSPMIVDSKMTELLYRLLSNYTSGNQPISSSDTKFSEVLDYIDTHFSSELCICDIADKFGYDKSYFCRKFKSQTGVTCLEYLNAIRLEAAAEMLKTGNITVVSVAANCGYKDANYFSRAFKKKYGVSPTKWQEHRKSAEKSGN